MTGTLCGLERFRSGVEHRRTITSTTPHSRLGRHQSSAPQTVVCGMETATRPTMPGRSAAAVTKPVPKSLFRCTLAATILVPCSHGIQPSMLPNFSIHWQHGPIGPPKHPFRASWWLPMSSNTNSVPACWSLAIPYHTATGMKVTRGHESTVLATSKKPWHEIKQYHHHTPPVDQIPLGSGLC